jgi:hypothetical protein
MGRGFTGCPRRVGIFEAAAPQMLRELTASRQRAAAGLTGRYGLACRPVRDLRVDDLQERQPAPDHSSLRKPFCRPGDGGLEKCLIAHGAAEIHWGQTGRAPYDRTHAGL